MLEYNESFILLPLSLLFQRQYDSLVGLGRTHDSINTQYNNDQHHKTTKIYGASQLGLSLDTSKYKACSIITAFKSLYYHSHSRNSTVQLNLYCLTGLVFVWDTWSDIYWICLCICYCWAFEHGTI